MNACIKIFFMTVVCVVFCACAAQPDNEQPEPKKAYKEVDFSGFCDYREEVLLRIIEDPSYSPKTRSDALLSLACRYRRPGLPVLKRLFKIPLNAWPRSNYYIVNYVPIMLEELGPVSRREATPLYIDYCICALKEKAADDYRGKAIFNMMSIGFFVPFFDHMASRKKNDYSTTIVHSYLWGPLTSEDGDARQQLLQSCANDKAYYDVISGVITETDWVSKLRPSNEADCKKLEDLVTQFGDNNPKVRENAREELLKAGIEAYAALSAGKKNKDLTVKTTCNVMLSKYPFIIPVKAKENVEKFHLDRDVQLLAVLLESKDKSLAEAAHVRLKKITTADLPAKREEWDKWHTENASYAEWNEDENRYDINADAKASGLEMFKWNLIPKEDRAKWSDLKPEEKEGLVSAAKQKYQDMLDKEEADRLAFNKPYDDDDKDMFGEIEED